MKGKNTFSAERSLGPRFLRAASSLVLIGLVLFSVLLVAGTRPSSGEQAMPPSRGMDERVSLDLRSTEVTDALKYLATKGALNLAISKNVAGRVNLFLNDIPSAISSTSSCAATSWPTTNRERCTIS